MKLRYKSATLAVKHEYDDVFQLYAVFAEIPGRGHGSGLVKRAVEFLAGRTICLHVEPFGHEALNTAALYEFYGRCGFVPGDDGWMWIWP